MLAKQRIRVLIVDDSVESLNFLTDALEDAGFTVLVALNGLAAMTLVDRVAPDLVLMDAVMPGIDGFETCRRLKASAFYVDLPVIFMTGLSETEDIIRGFQVGGVDYVTKPVVPDKLLPRIQRHLATAQSVRSARTALDLTGRFLIAVDSSGRTVWSTPQATRLLREVFNDDAAGAFIVPPELAACLSPPLNGHAESTKMKVGDRSLEMIYVGKVSDGEILLRLAIAEAAAVQRLGEAHGLGEHFHVVLAPARTDLSAAAPGHAAEVHLEARVYLEDVVDDLSWRAGYLRRWRLRHQ